MVVHARNSGDAAGLIAELRAGEQRWCTDRSWEVARSDRGPGVPAEEVAPFVGSLWYEHPQGPPRLEASTAPVAQKLEVGPLAMSFYNAPDVLPFDCQPQVSQPAGWYRFQSPPGLRGLTIHARGKVRAWAGGREMRSTDGKRFEVSAVEPKPVTVLLRLEQERGFYGGAALRDYIQLDCGPGQWSTGDWSKLDGLLSYSGGAWYRKSIRVPAARQVVLDLGEVVASAEVRVNGKEAGVRVAGPWRFDISSLVKPGENRIEVLVYNTLGNHYTTIPTSYRGSIVAGLLGPVTVRTLP
jgi:hypothetical protein